MDLANPNKMDLANPNKHKYIKQRIYSKSSCLFEFDDVRLKHQTVKRPSITNCI